MKVAIFGLGVVGLSLTCVLGYKGYSVIGIDSDRNKVLRICKGDPTFYEPKLENMLKLGLKKSLEISTDYNVAVKKCDFIFITVGTPQSKKGAINLDQIKRVTMQIGTSLSKTRNSPTIIIKSTVTPGVTQNIVKPILEEKSNKKDGTGFKLLFNPTFIREGSAIDDTIKPHVNVIGGNDSKSIRTLEKFYLELYKKIPIIITNYQTAELIKYVNNSFLAAKLGLINEISNICQSLPGTNIDDVVKAIGLDPRIGNLFLKAGPGYGGSCLPKDIPALVSFSSSVGRNSIILKAIHRSNISQVNSVISLIRNTMKKIDGKKISILGLSFKEQSDELRESVSIKLIKLLLKKGAHLTVHDPMAIENTKVLFGNKIQYATSVKDVLRQSQCAVIMTPWKEYSYITNKDLSVMKKRLIIDTRRQLNYTNLDAEYHAIGIG